MKSNKKRVSVLAIAAVLALAGVGGSLAYIFTSSSDSQEVTNEAAVKLDWGTTTNLADVASLSPAAPQFQEVTYTSSKSTSATGFAKITFTLTVDALNNGDFEIYIGTESFKNQEMPSVETYKKLGTMESTLKTCSYVTDINTESTTLYLKYVALETAEAVTYNAKLNVKLEYAQSATEGWQA